ncbi:MAG: DUF296 domain-containing protein [Gammaproteobacteria bacterium]|nr:DUF296 domain-containing protein [Gammaproteobacteria bacterium]
MDLRLALERRAERPPAIALAVVTCCGSLDGAMLRPADQSEAQLLSGPLEILSLAGTLSLSGVHLHLTVGDGQGAVFGGHLLAGCRIRTTAEIVLAALPDAVFRRNFDPRTGWRELTISPRPSARRLLRRSRS